VFIETAFKEQQKLQIEVYDEAGRIFLSSSVTDVRKTTIPVDLSNFAQGYYTLRIATPKKQIDFKTLIIK
jgi:hypothetical protein